MKSLKSGCTLSARGAMIMVLILIAVLMDEVVQEVARQFNASTGLYVPLIVRGPGVSEVTVPFEIAEPATDTISISKPAP